MLLPSFNHKASFQPFQNGLFHHFDFVSKCLIATTSPHVPTTNQVVPSPPRTATSSDTINKTREAERDFCDLSIRRDERHVVDPPLVFKMVFFSGDEGARERSPALDGEKEKSHALDRKKHERRPLVGTDWKRVLKKKT
ncbi:hypothetical protein TNCV_4905361 [Trichonephila clavipes]|uniref:Uncharacterized protein n=1 Tax=Trichonephila clavipes TaxID=2585209 RepID=A0A8X6RPD8_TRICX|nr:hypothetical protein TNCV_4905361 [Trichonephila clavipes]